MRKWFRSRIIALFSIILFFPITIEAGVYNQGVIYVSYDETTTVRLPDYLISEYNYHSGVPYDGGGTLTWDVSDKCLSILWTGNFECHISPNHSSPFPDYVTLTASFISWYGEIPQNTQAVWTVKLKESVDPDPNVEDISIDETHFPDEMFRSYLLNQDYGRDGVLTSKELAKIDFIDVQHKGICDLEGIQYFYGLKKLYCCHGNQIKFLDMSKNTNLETLCCQENQLEYLNVTENTALKVLQCYKNQLSYIDVSNNTLLEELDCHDNQLTSLDVTKNPALKVLDCGNWASYSFKNRLTSLDVTKNPQIYKLWCQGNELTSLDVTKNTLLYNFDCARNHLTTIDVRNNNLGYLDCASNQLTSLNVSKYTNLYELSCSHNPLNTLDVSKNTKLKELFCDDNLLTSLDVTNNPNLEWLSCNDNFLTSIDVSKQKDLVYFKCGNNQLTSLDVSKCTKIQFVDCQINKIKGTEMDNLISSLPYYSTQRSHWFRVIDYTQGTEGNVCTKDQVRNLKNKGWYVYYYDGSDWISYVGSDENSVNNITLNTTSATLHIGDVISLQAMVSPEEALDKSVTWSSDNMDVAAVDDNGKVTAMAIGLANIYCKANDGSGVMAACKVTVEAVPPTAISIPSSAAVVIGSAITLSPTFTPANATASLTWSSDDETIAKVSNEGVVIGLKKGQTFINVETDNGITAYCKLTVKAPEPIAIVLSNSTTLYVGETQKLIPTLIPENSETTLTWMSDDETVVQVSDDGVLTGVAEGLALVSVSTANGLVSNVCKVKVEINLDGIKHVHLERTNNKIVYSLSGQQLTAPRKGINIIGGKKVVVR